MRNVKKITGMFILVFTVSFIELAKPVEAKTCPKDKKFKTTKKWKGCKCPDGYKKKYLDKFKYNARCQSTSENCPTGKDFKTTKRWKGCKCPDGYWKEYQDVAKYNARCRKGKSDAQKCSEKGGKWVKWGKGFCTDVISKVMSGINSAANPRVHAYDIYFNTIVGNGVTLRNLPDNVQNKLKGYYTGGLLKKVKYGASHHTSSDNAMTDCYKIYFPAGSGHVVEIKNGTILKSDKIWLLLHELTHTEQCLKIGGRGNYAEMWFSQLDMTTIKELIKDPGKISSKRIHNRMPMEKEANQKADNIYKKIK